MFGCICITVLTFLQCLIVVKVVSSGFMVKCTFLFQQIFGHEISKVQRIFAKYSQALKEKFCLCTAYMNHNETSFHNKMRFQSHSRMLVFHNTVLREVVYAGNVSVLFLFLPQRL